MGKIDSSRERAFRVGDRAYYIEHGTGNIIGGGVFEIGTTCPLSRPSEQLLNIKVDGPKFRKEIQPAAKCYGTYNEASAAKTAAKNGICMKYRSEIHSVNDLVKFMYTHVVCQAEEYTDWEARKVAREKAKELLDLELEE